MHHRHDIPTADEIKATLFGLANLLAAPWKRPPDDPPTARHKRPLERQVETSGWFDAT